MSALTPRQYAMRWATRAHDPGPSYAYRLALLACARDIACALDDTALIRHVQVVEQDMLRTEVLRAMQINRHQLNLEDLTRTELKQLAALVAEELS